MKEIHTDANAVTQGLTSELEPLIVRCPDPTHGDRPDILFEFCKITDPRYKEIRDRHYVSNAGACGQQVHFLVWSQGKIAGIISAGSSVYAVAERDKFFDLPKDKELKGKALVKLVNNTVFRLENHELHLATRVLASWRKIISSAWLDLYGAPVVGFETFVVEEDLADGRERKGKLYEADNWKFVGYTKGSAKSHRGLRNPQTRKKTERKLIFVRRNDDAPYEYKLWTKWIVGHQSSWEAKSAEEKALKKGREAKRKYLVGRLFFYHGGEVWRTTDDGAEPALAADCIVEEAETRYLEKQRRRAAKAGARIETAAAD
jgi:hypothetical protein